LGKGAAPLKLLSGVSSYAGFRFTLSGPPGSYQIETSPDLLEWEEWQTIENEIGLAEVTDPDAVLSYTRFYRARKLE
jgi:hypothetical protein